MGRSPLSFGSRATALALVTVVLAACSSDGEPRVAPTPHFEPGPVVSISFPDGQPRYGELARARIAVANGDADPIMVRGIEIPGQLPERRNWVVSRSGRLRYEKRHRRWEWDPRGRDETPASFVRGLIFPGEALEVDRWLRIRGPTHDIVLLYSSIPAVHFHDLVYLPRERPGTGNRVVFERASVSAQGRYRRLRAGTEERVVVVDRALEFGVVRRSFSVDTPWAGDDPTPGVINALRSVEGFGDVSGEVSQWTSGAAWLVRDPRDGGVRVLPETGDVESFWDVDFTVFDLADAAAITGEGLLVEAIASTTEPPRANRRTISRSRANRRTISRSRASRTRTPRQTPGSRQCPSPPSSCRFRPASCSRCCARRRPCACASIGSTRSPRSAFPVCAFPVCACALVDAPTSQRPS